MENLKNTVNEALADIVLLKQEKIILKTDMQSEIKSGRVTTVQIPFTYTTIPFITHSQVTCIQAPWRYQYDHSVDR